MQNVDQLSIFDFGLDESVDKKENTPYIIHKVAKEVITPQITKPPVLEPLYKVGDKVRVKDKENYPIKTVEDRWAVSIYGGCEGVVTEVHGVGTPHISYLLDFPEKRECYFNENEISSI